MQSSPHQFPSSARVALSNTDLRDALGRAKAGFIGRRTQAVAAFPEFEDTRAAAREIKEHTLQHLDYYLERFEAQVVASGGHVHWASTPADACRIVVEICRDAGAHRVIKGKSMVAEEIGLNEALESAGLERIETDLGEYIVQLADEPPSHIIAPAIHKTKEQISDLFQSAHARYGLTERQTEARALISEARTVLRDKFLSADVGITGANFLVAETGSTVIVTNEGNGDLTNTLPKVHIVTAGIEKVLPTLDDVSTVLRVLARSATGQEMSVYTTFSTGPRRADDLDGPEAFHVVLVDNGRSQMLGNEFHPMLRCIRCGACMNHCPVYLSVGGHTYGSVYVGPMGSVLTPLIVGLDEARHHPNACTLNGRCQEVCPMKIPLPDMLRAHRRRQYEQRLTPARARTGLGAWAFLAKRPRLYAPLTGVAARALAWLGARRGRLRYLPFASGWTSVRDLPSPQGRTFQAAWHKAGGARQS